MFCFEQFSGRRFSNPNWRSLVHTEIDTCIVAFLFLSLFVCRRIPTWQSECELSIAPRNLWLNAHRNTRVQAEHQTTSGFEQFLRDLEQFPHDFEQFPRDLEPVPPHERLPYINTITTATTGAEIRRVCRRALQATASFVRNLLWQGKSSTTANHGRTRNTVPESPRPYVLPEVLFNAARASLL